MENIYTLTGKYAEANSRYEDIAAQLEMLYEEQGGEVSEQTEEMEALKDELAILQQNITTEIIENADKYAEIALNKAAQRKQMEAELKALKEEQKKAQDRVQARINRLERSEEFWKSCFDGAMKVADTRKIGGAKTNLMHSIYYKTSESIEVDNAVVLAPYQEIIDDLVACLPTWAKVEINASKSELKKVEQLPEGATRVQSETIIIR